MNLHYISFSKWTPEGPIRCQFVILRKTRQEAKTIAEKEVNDMHGYRYAGCD